MGVCKLTSCHEENFHQEIRTQLERCTNDAACVGALLGSQEVVPVAAATAITEWHAHQLLWNEAPPLEVASAGSGICFLHANHWRNKSIFERVFKEDFFETSRRKNLEEEGLGKSKT